MMIRIALLLGLLSAPALAAQPMSYAIIGDAGLWNDLAKSVRDSILRDPGTRALILPGDNLYDRNRTYAEVWNPWSQSGLTFDVVSLGNHHGGYVNELRFFGMPGEYFTKKEGGLVRFIVLNSDNNGKGGEQARWLEGELAAATEKYVFLVFHHPSFSITSFHDWREKTAFHTAVRPVIWKNRAKITALLVGHDHIASLLTFDDLPVVVSGAVHELRRPEVRDDVQEGVRVKTQWLFGHRPYWVRLRIADDQAGAQIEFVRADNDHVACTALISTGRTPKLSANCANGDK